MLNFTGVYSFGKCREDFQQILGSIEYHFLYRVYVSERGIQLNRGRVDVECDTHASPVIVKCKKVGKQARFCHVIQTLCCSFPLVKTSVYYSHMSHGPSGLGIYFSKRDSFFVFFNFLRLINSVDLVARKYRINM